MSRRKKPRVFVGSSAEHLDLALAVQASLERHSTVTVWTQGVFALSSSTLDGLVDAVSQADFAVFVLAPDDRLSMRGNEHVIARDNVVFELGLFIGALGRSRTFFLKPRGVDKYHLPTDLLGIMGAEYDGERALVEPMAALGSACFQIGQVLRRFDGGVPIASMPVRRSGGLVDGPASPPALPTGVDIEAEKESEKTSVPPVLVGRPSSALVELVRVPAGRFIMGRGRHKGVSVSISRELWFSKNLITQELFNEILGRNPSKFRGANLPVDSVSWFDCLEFCNQLSVAEGLAPVYEVDGRNVSIFRERIGYRLPTEAEWEFACAGHTTNGAPDPEQHAWCSANSGGHTHAVGELSPNHLGICDMLGNLWEWCEDWYQRAATAHDLVDPVGPATGIERVLRGGAWSTSRSSVSATYRYRRSPSSREPDQGFRVVKSLAV